MLNKKYTAVRTLLLTIFVTALFGSGAWGQTFNVLHAFEGAPGDGEKPLTGQVFDGQGNLYGVTESGGDACGNGGCGTVYQLKRNSDGSWTETVIHAFDGDDGTYPFTSPVFDSQGNIDGATWAQDHGQDAGFVYQLVPGANGSWTESVLHEFSAPWEGGEPSELTLDTEGNIYGAATSGGVHDAGTIFSLNRSSGWQDRLIHAFDGYPGAGGGEPEGAITFDSNGNLYGTTFIDGTYNDGVVFKMTNQGGSFWHETVLYTFTGASDGRNPTGVVFGPDGSLYGTTVDGGNMGNSHCSLGCGTVFRLTPNPDGTWTKTVPYVFRGGPGDGALPYAHITSDVAGNIYGTTAAGGSASSPCPSDGCGTVFKLTPSSGGQWTESILHFFTGGLDGFNPQGPVAIDAAGNLYGTAYFGGAYNYGVAYEITP